MNRDLKAFWKDIISGKKYQANDPRLIEKLEHTRVRLWEFNNLRPDRTDEMKNMIQQLSGILAIISISTSLFDATMAATSSLETISLPTSILQFSTRHA